MIKTRGEKNFVFSMPSRGSSIMARMNSSGVLSLLLSRQNHPPSRGYIFEMVNRCTAISKGVVARVCALRGDCLRPLKLLLCLLYSRSPSLDSRFRTDDDWFSSSNILPTLLLPLPSLFFAGSILICCRWTQRLYVQT